VQSAQEASLIIQHFHLRENASEYRSDERQKNCRAGIAFKGSRYGSFHHTCL
jgi:hypothetical protein